MDLRSHPRLQVGCALEAHLPRELPLAYVTDIVMPEEELQKTGMTRQEMWDALGKHTQLHVKQNVAESTAEARRLASPLRPVHHPGFAFTTSQTKTKQTRFPPTGFQTVLKNFLQWLLVVVWETANIKIIATVP